MAGTDSSGAARVVVPLGVSLSLIGIALAVSIGLKAANVPVMEHSAMAAVVAVALALVAVRILWSRHATRPARSDAFFWANLALSALALYLSPVFGLPLFLGYVEAAQLRGAPQRVAAMLGTAAVISVGQIGGVRSPIFTPLFYALFVLVNVGIAGLMTVLDRQRAALTARLAAANAELVAEQARSSELRERLVAQAREAGIQDERSRLSREIHDTVAQDLVAIIAQLDAARAATDEDHEHTRRLAVADAAAREALAEARRAVHALASPRLDDSDLPGAIAGFVAQWRAATGVEGTFRVEGAVRAGAHDDDLLRAAQESLANVAKHARARAVQVRLAYAPEAVSLTVTDDGDGFDTETATPGHGLAGMRQRLARIGGSMVLMSEPGAGTTVVARVPLDAGEEGA